MNTATKTCLLLSLLWLGGCATRPVTPAAPTPTRQCLNQLAQLQSAIADAGVEDAQYVRVPGFPTYRTNRFWSSFADTDLTAEQTRDWRHQLHLLGMTSLGIEWRNLPEDARNRLPWHDGFIGFSRRCDDRLWQASLQQPLSSRQLAVPDSYSDWQRIFGLYAITRHLAASSIETYRKDMRSRMLDTPAFDSTRVFGYVPRQDTSPGAAAAPLEFPLPVSSLGIPQLSDAQLHVLLQFNAPRLQVEGPGGDNHIGAARWHDNRREVNTNVPEVYAYPSFMRSRQGVLLQLNYTFWFPQRPKTGVFDWYGGTLDGLVWRVTLDRNGQVLFYDSIHPCGCYYSVFLPRDSQLKIPPGKADKLLAFTLPFNGSTANPVLQIQRDTHYLLHVFAQAPMGTDIRSYVLNRYDNLRSLPDGHGFRDWFDPDGLIAESARFERFFLWPLGVPSAGAMRQQGHQAIAFVGRRHFDAAWLEEFFNPP